MVCCVFGQKWCMFVFQIILVEKCIHLGSNEMKNCQMWNFGTKQCIEADAPCVCALQMPANAATTLVAMPRRAPCWHAVKTKSPNKTPCVQTKIGHVLPHTHTRFQLTKRPPCLSWLCTRRVGRKATSPLRWHLALTTPAKESLALVQVKTINVI